MDIQFIPPTLDDAENWLDVQIRAFHHDAQMYPGVKEDGPPGYDSLDVQKDDFEQHPCYKIVADGRLIGGIVVFIRDAEHYHLDRVFIDPDYHNQGIGTQAMNFLHTTYPVRLWTLDTPTYATRNQHFYEKLGYIRTGEAHHQDISLISYERRV